MGLELLSSHAQGAVREAGVLPQAAQLLREPAVGDLHHVHGVLPGDVDRVLHHTHLRERNQFNGKKKRYSNNNKKGLQ